MNLKFALVAYAIRGRRQTGVTIVEIKKIYIWICCDKHSKLKSTSMTQGKQMRK